MSSFAVTVEQITVHPHPNADRLELAQVGLYRAVVAKGQYRTGEYAIYIPEQAVLPDDLIEELGLVGRLAGKARNRVKAVRLRGEVSQGIVCRPAAVSGIEWHDAHADGTDFADKLGIVKWVPDVPAHLNGEVEPAPNLLRWVDIENLQRYPDIFREGEHVIATEKVHGTACLVTYDAEAETLLVSSKGHGSKSLALRESDTNLYWRAVRQYELRERLAKLCADYEATRVGLFGEVFGAGVQDLHYGANVCKDDQIGYRAFDMRVGDELGDPWISARAFHDICGGYDIPTVPVLYDGPFDLAALAGAASGVTQVGGGNIREGVVIRPLMERYSAVLGGRAIAKLISPAYLLRSGDTTEFE